MALPMNEGPNSKSSQSKTLQGGNTVELWYANRIYSVKVRSQLKNPNSNRVRFFHGAKSQPKALRSITANSRTKDSRRLRTSN